VVEALVFRREESEGVSVCFEASILRFPASNEWSGAKWELVVGTSITKLRASSIAEISVLEGSFEVAVIDGEGMCHGPYLIQSVLCGYPNFTYCFLFHADEEGMWSGHTVTKSFGRIVVVPYRTDPT
jgi:hypothetical protein